MAFSEKAAICYCAQVATLPSVCLLIQDHIHFTWFTISFKKPRLLHVVQWRLWWKIKKSAHIFSPGQNPGFPTGPTKALLANCSPFPDGLSGHGCWAVHFLNGVSLLKVCQKMDGFRFGSAKANTCCCGILVGTVTWRWWIGCKLWCSDGIGHPL